jgi:hypothetical protein
MLYTRVNLVDPCEHKNENNYYYSFKNRLEGRLGAKSKSRGGLTMTRVNHDSGQRNDKNNYNYSFKT